MALSPDTSEFIQGLSFPISTHDVIEGLRRKEKVVVRYGSALDVYLSEMDTELPQGGTIIYQSGTQDELQGVEPEVQEVSSTAEVAA